MADLKTTYKDDLLDTSVNEKRKYNMIQNADGTVSFEDVTVYSQIGDSFGAGDVNNANEKINGLNNALNKIDVYVGDDGALHYVDKDGADSVLPFSTKNYLYKCGDTSFRDIVSNVVSGTSSYFSFEENYLKIYTYGNGIVSFDVDVTDINYIYFDLLSNSSGRSINFKDFSDYFSYNIINVSSYTGIISISFGGNGQISHCRNIYGVKELQ